MYGIMGQMKTASGQRDEVIKVLLEAIQGMPGCLSYIVAKDLNDPDTIWITEAWDSADSHRASLALPQVQQAIARVKPSIVGFGERIETAPVGGVGLASAA